MKSESELRDYFAGQALNGRMSNVWWGATDIENYRMAHQFYKIADAMMHARGEKDRMARAVAEQNEGKEQMAELNRKIAESEAKEKK